MNLIKIKINIALYNLIFFYKFIILFPFIFSILFLISINNIIYAKKAKFVVTLDAGHGGHDYGAVYDAFKEKDISLSIVLKLGKKIELEQKDVKVVYTRTNDSYPQLYHRAAIANLNKSNLFISIHCNSSKELSESAVGTETWILGSQIDKNNNYYFHVLSKENFVIFLEKICKDNYNNYNENIPEYVIAKTLVQDAFLENSLHFALMMEKNFQFKENRISRGIKQAPFLILVHSFMPSVLIEVGFLNHPEESYYLASEYGQNKIVNSIYETFFKYKKEYYRRSGISL